MVRIIGCCHPKARDDGYVGEQLTWERMQQVANDLPGTKILDTHFKNLQVGKIRRSWIDGERQLWVLGEIDETTAAGRRVAQLIRSGKYRGLSLGMTHGVAFNLQNPSCKSETTALSRGGGVDGHASTNNQQKDWANVKHVYWSEITEVSVCEEGKYPNTVLHTWFSKILPPPSARSSGTESISRQEFSETRRLDSSGTGGKKSQPATDSSCAPTVLAFRQVKEKNTVPSSYLQRSVVSKQKQVNRQKQHDRTGNASSVPVQKKKNSFNENNHIDQFEPNRKPYNPVASFQSLNNFSLFTRNAKRLNNENNAKGPDFPSQNKYLFQHHHRLIRSNMSNNNNNNSGTGAATPAGNAATTTMPTGTPNPNTAQTMQQQLPQSTTGAASNASVPPTTAAGAQQTGVGAGAQPGQGPSSSSRPNPLPRTADGKFAPYRDSPLPPTKGGNKAQQQQQQQQQVDAQQGQQPEAAQQQQQTEQPSGATTKTAETLKALQTELQQLRADRKKTSEELAAAKQALNVFATGAKVFLKTDDAGELQRKVAEHQQRVVTEAHDRAQKLIPDLEVWSRNVPDDVRGPLENLKSTIHAFAVADPALKKDNALLQDAINTTNVLNHIKELSEQRVAAERNNGEAVQKQLADTAASLQNLQSKHAQTLNELQVIKRQLELLGHHPESGSGSTTGGGGAGHSADASTMQYQAPPPPQTTAQALANGMNGFFGNGQTPILQSRASATNKNPLSAGSGTTNQSQGTQNSANRVFGSLSGGTTTGNTTLKGFVPRVKPGEKRTRNDAQLDTMQSVASASSTLSQQPPSKYACYRVPNTVLGSFMSREYREAYEAPNPKYGQLSALTDGLNQQLRDNGLPTRMPSGLIYHGPELTTAAQGGGSRY